MTDKEYIRGLKLYIKHQKIAIKEIDKEAKRKIRCYEDCIEWNKWKIKKMEAK